MPTQMLTGGTARRGAAATDSPGPARRRAVTKRDGTAQGKRTRKPRAFGPVGGTWIFVF
ncbi:hypothetical protein BGLA2_420003 [Burkholderia gladioli]|nr:hypothetical protein BGLA2_420003 [Burkholderia gladioli]